jgi:RNA polymerase sigma-70 factor (ECF subfamily)
MTDEADRIYERVLVLQCQTGDDSAFAELIARYVPRMRYYLRKLVGDGSEVDDLLQEVWLDVFRALPRLADPGAFPAWLYRLARDRAFRRLRRRSPYLLGTQHELNDQPDREEEFTADDVAWVHAALDRLPPDHREVLVLRFLEGMAYEDVARVIGCPLGTVKSRIYHAKRGLRRAIEELQREP